METIERYNDRTRQKNFIVISFPSLISLLCVAAKAFENTSKYRGQIFESENTVFDHRYQRIGSNIKDQSKQIQGAEKEHKQMAEMIDPLMQTTQSAFELMANSNT